MSLSIVPHPTDVKLELISHVRHIVKRLELPEEFQAETRIQVGAKHYYCVEQPQNVVDLVDQARQAKGRLPLARLTLPGGKPVWFAGELAEGPVRLDSGQIGDGIHSAFRIGELLTRVRDMPEEVAKVIKAAKGKQMKPSGFIGLSRQTQRKKSLDSAEEEQMIARVYEVTAVAVDFTFTDGDHAPALKVFAKGRVNSGGWSNFELGVWTYIHEPKDGVLDLDFLGMPPPEGTIVTTGFVNVNAGLVLSVPDWVKGVRVHASTNRVEAMLADALPSAPVSFEQTGKGALLPWPFPWYTPGAGAALPKAASTTKGGN